MPRPLILVPYPKPDYIDALVKAGADVRTMEGAGSVKTALDGIDGVLLTGGADIDPALYHQPRHPATEDAQPGRDALELAIAKRAIDDDVPLLAICRGVQVLNVAAGGTLVQDIPSELGQAVDHDVREPRDAEAHAVRVSPGSRLARALESEINEHNETTVNSRHHQALAAIAPGMAVTAVAPDDVIEAIERTDRRFCLGVQWHPENFHSSGRFAGLFEAFVHAASRDDR